jgi:superfamily II DNA or RNA helicase
MDYYERPLVSFRIEIYSHFFKVTDIQPYFLATLKNFQKQFVQYEMDKQPGYKPQFRPVRIFASNTKNNKEFRFHINTYDSFVAFLKLKGIPLRDDDIKIMPYFSTALLSHPYKFTKELRDYQEKAIQHIFKDIPDQHTRLLGMPTGTGKTFTGLYACSKVGKRVIIFLLPQYIPKWVLDIQENMNVSSKSIMTVRGADQLKGLLDLGASNELSADYILISVRTMQNYIDMYNLDPEYTIQDYGCIPEDMYKVLKVGQVMIDETHQHIHAIFRIMMFMHVEILLALSATLISDDLLIKICIT